MKSFNYICNLCDDKYSHKVDYYKHLRLHFNSQNMHLIDQEFINKFCCKICKILYKTNQSLLYHLSNHPINILITSYNRDYIDHIYKIKSHRSKYNSIHYRKIMNNESTHQQRIERQRIYRINNHEKILERYHSKRKIN